MSSAFSQEISNMSDDSKDSTTLKYEEILKANGITDEISEIIVKDAGLRGEGMASISQCVTVKFADMNLKQLNLFVKAQSHNESHTQMIDELKAFEKEARFFMEYVPAGKEFCKRNGLDGFVDIYPKCYYGDEKLIVLEHLVLDKGYTMVDKLVLQNLEEARFALGSLAKHHALSHAMILDHGGREKFFEKFKELDFVPAGPLVRSLMEPSMENGLTTMIKLLEKNAVDGRDEALSILRSKVGNIYERMMEVQKYGGREAKLLVLCHGDYWNNNMMFLRDKESNMIKHHIAIDLQVTSYNSPLMDVGYYLFTSVQHDVRRAHLEELLQIYLEALLKYSNDLNYPIDLSYEDMLLQFRKTFEFGYWLGLCLISGPTLVMVKDVDFVDLEGDVADWGSLMVDLIDKWIENNPEEGPRMANDVVAHMNEYKQLLE